MPKPSPAPEALPGEALPEEALPEAPAEPVVAPVSLEQAFFTLCAALQPLLEDDMPRYYHCEEIQGWYANGNTTIAWIHGIALLEGVLGHALVSR